MLHPHVIVYGNGRRARRGRRPRKVKRNPHSTALREEEVGRKKKKMAAKLSYSTGELPRFLSTHTHTHTSESRGWSVSRLCLCLCVCHREPFCHRLLLRRCHFLHLPYYCNGPRPGEDPDPILLLLLLLVPPGAGKTHTHITPKKRGRSSNVLDMWKILVV